MIVEVDISIFSSSSSIGNLSGKIKLAICPMVGDLISFHQPVFEGVSCPLSVKFNGLLKVIGRVIGAGSLESNITIVCEDLIVDDRCEALSVINYLEAGFGLYATVYEDS